MSPRISIVGLGPAGIDRLNSADLARLVDPETRVIVRTLAHPAAVALAAERSVTSCDDLYEGGGDFEDVYGAIVDRVVSAAGSGPVVYAVPGSPNVGERAVKHLTERAARDGIECEVFSGESFVDLACAAVGIDPITDGLQVLDARALPDPLSLHLPSLITQIDTPLVVGEVALALGRLLPDSFRVTMLDRLGGPDGSCDRIALADLPKAEVSSRSTLFVPAADVGWFGLVATNRTLRDRCPWDARQTHHTLVSHLIEEAYEAVDAIGSLPVDAPAGDVDLGDYLLLEEELGDLLLQVVFHATLAAEAGAFDVDEVAEGIRRKIVHRHPHVFGDVVADEVDDVLANWEELKNAEKGRTSLMDDVPKALPGISRADKLQKRAATVGFDWPDATPVFAKVDEELAELEAVKREPDRATAELGDLLFAVVNLARHLGVDPEIALARANDTFAERFRIVERLVEQDGRRLRELDLAEMDRLWEVAKAERSTNDAGSSYTLRPERKRS